MTTSDDSTAMNRRIEMLENEFRSYTAAHQAVFDDLTELFTELGKGLDMVATSLEEMTPLDEDVSDDTGGTGLMGRAFELQALVGIYRRNLADLQDRLRSLRS